MNITMYYHVLTKLISEANDEQGHIADDIVQTAQTLQSLLEEYEEINS